MCGPRKATVCKKEKKRKKRIIGKLLLFNVLKFKPLKVI